MDFVFGIVFVGMQQQQAPSIIYTNNTEKKKKERSAFRDHRGENT